VIASCLLGGCGKPQQDATGENAASAGKKGSSDEVTLSTQMQAEQKIEVAPVELGTAVVSQRAKGHVALPDNATWHAGVLAEGRFCIGIAPGTTWLAELKIKPFCVLIN
jgi:cobalt-zinc-cadmium efflux system membrane fusion protein